MKKKWNKIDIYSKNTIFDSAIKISGFLLPLVCCPLIPVLATSATLLASVVFLGLLSISLPMFVIYSGIAVAMVILILSVSQWWIWFVAVISLIIFSPLLIPVLVVLLGSLAFVFFTQSIFVSLSFCFCLTPVLVPHVSYILTYFIGPMSLRSSDRRSVVKVVREATKLEPIDGYFEVFCYDYIRESSVEKRTGLVVDGKNLGARGPYETIDMGQKSYLQVHYRKWVTYSKKFNIRVTKSSNLFDPKKLPKKKDCEDDLIHISCDLNLRIPKSIREELEEIREEIREKNESRDKFVSVEYVRPKLEFSPNKEKLRRAVDDSILSWSGDDLPTGFPVFESKDLHKAKKKKKKKKKDDDDDDDEVDEDNNKKSDNINFLLFFSGFLWCSMVRYLKKFEFYEIKMGRKVDEFEIVEVANKDDGEDDEVEYSFQKKKKKKGKGKKKKKKKKKKKEEEEEIEIEEKFDDNVYGDDGEPLGKESDSDDNLMKPVIGEEDKDSYEDGESSGEEEEEEEEEDDDDDDEEEDSSGDVDSSSDE